MPKSCKRLRRSGSGSRGGIVSYSMKGRQYIIVPVGWGGWFGIIGPAGVPREITTLLNKEINWALQQADVRDRMKKMGLDIHTESPEFFTDLMNKDFENWGKVIKGMGFKPM